MLGRQRARQGIAARQLEATSQVGACDCGEEAGDGCWLQQRTSVTVTVYVWVVCPSCAVTTTVMKLPDPTPSGTTPSWSTTPLSFTSTLALASLAVAETVVYVTAFPTDAAYTVVPAANPGTSVTPLNDSPLSEASADPARVTTRARQFEQFHQILLGGDTVGDSAH